MIKKPRVICFIPARSGSTRVKNKNIRIIKGRPLIYWTVFRAIQSRMFNKIIFSSDSEQYFKILVKFLKKDKLNFNNLVFDKRNTKHSKTKSKIFDYLKFDLINKYELKKNDLLVQMLPTCPLRSEKTVKIGINSAIENNKNLFSVCEYDFHIAFGLSIKKKNWSPAFNNSPLITGSTQSQSQKKYYHPTGVINCLHVKFLNKNKKSIYQNAFPMIVSRSESLDIDTEDDLELLRKVI